MTTWKENLKFRLLLYALYVLIRVAGLRSHRFKEKLKERDIAIVMRSKGGAIARTLRCTRGKVRSRKGHADDVISNITWASPAAGSRVMLKMIKGDGKALTNAVIQRDLLPEGEAAGIRWFLDVVTLLSKIYLKKKRSKRDTVSVGQ